MPHRPPHDRAQERLRAPFRRVGIPARRRLGRISGAASAMALGGTIGLLATPAAWFLASPTGR